MGNTASDDIAAVTRALNTMPAKAPPPENPMPKPSTITCAHFNRAVLRRPFEPEQYTTIAFAETLVSDRIAASISCRSSGPGNSRGGSYLDGLAEPSVCSVTGNVFNREAWANCGQVALEFVLGEPDVTRLVGDQSDEPVAQPPPDYTLEIGVGAAPTWRDRRGPARSGRSRCTSLCRRGPTAGRRGRDMRARSCWCETGCRLGCGSLTGRPPNRGSPPGPVRSPSRYPARGLGG